MGKRPGSRQAEGLNSNCRLTPAARLRYTRCMADSTDITRAAEILSAGGLVAFPTETVYGLGSDALNERAVARVFEVKGRPRFDPLIVHVPAVDVAANLAASFPAKAQKLAARFWPGPLTLVLPKKDIVPDLVTAGRATVALRVPDHPVALALLRATDRPIAAPSANPFGRVSPTTAEHVREQLGRQIDLVLDGGPCRVGVESTVVQVIDTGVRLLRPGGTTLEEIEALIGRVELPSAAQNDPRGSGMLSPGSLAQHYAPRTRLILWRRGEDLPTAAANSGLGWPPRLGLLAFRPFADADPFERLEILSPDGDLREATASFFAALRRLDASGLDLIVAEVFPEEGLGRALNDRLRRAAHK